MANKIALAIDDHMTTLETNLAYVANALAFVDALNNNGVSDNTTEKRIDFNNVARVLVADAATRSLECIELVQKIETEVSRG